MLWDGKTMRILLAEDDRVIADGLGRALRQTCYAVDWVANGSDAHRSPRSSLSTPIAVMTGALGTFYAIICFNPADPTGALASHGMSAQRRLSWLATRWMNGIS